MKAMFFNQWRQRAMVLLLSSALFGGCVLPIEEDANANNDDTQETGQLYLNLTDAPGDFLSYSVDVISIELEKENGVIVETLPLRTRVDFSEYVEMTEFVTAATIPSGKYVRATMTLDYTDAGIIVEDDSSAGVNIETIMDDEGNPISQLEMTVSLVNRNSLIIAPGIPAHLSLDFDLKASNHIEYDDESKPISVTVDPTLIASLEVDKDKELRIRGGLKDVDIANSSFDLFVRPFRHALKEDRRFGNMTVVTQDTTAFEIDGMEYVGDEGIQAMSGLAKLSAVVAFGQIDFENRTLVAHQVFAGSSVPGGDLDLIAGHVIARTGNTLTIKGARLERNDGSIHIGNTMEVTIAETTLVRKPGFAEKLTIEAISVGQRVHVLGKTDEVNNDVFDASEGLVRLLLTNVRGDILSIDESLEYPLTMHAQRFDQRRAALFDFSGTGVSPEDDADPQNYIIDTTTLDLSSFQANDPVIVRGHVNSFGHAPADFVAQSLIGIKALAGNLAVSWDQNANNALVVETDNSLTASVYAENHFHHVVRRGTRNDLTLGGETVSLQAEHANHWTILLSDERIIHTDYDSFVNDLNSKLADNTLVLRGIHAHGSYDDDSRVFKAEQITIKFL